jgi:hypothetical protein
VRAARRVDETSGSPTSGHNSTGQLIPFGDTIDFMLSPKHYAAVHIELRALFFLPPPDVGHPKQATQVETAMDQIKRQLAAVNVARQRQVKRDSPTR